jgi:trk system potassium uptake protein TrkH
MHMRIGPVLFILGKVLLVLGGAMLLPLAVAVSFGQGDALPFVYSIAPTWLCAALLLFFCRKSAHTTLRQREGFLFVSLVWLSAAIFGALPFRFDGVFHVSFADALFESMSGFTTTGATILQNIEHMPKGLLFWRAFTHWLGGAGIVLMFVAFLSGKDGSGVGAQIFNAEHSGGELADKITPRISDGAKALCLIYVGITLVEATLLVMGGMDLYDAFTHAFGTVSTGGFSTKNLSIAHYNSAYIEWVIIVFMFLSSINLGLYYQLLIRNRSKIIHDEETRVFALICLFTTIAIAINLSKHEYYADHSLGYIIREAAFQTVSVISTTGYVTANYDVWPSFSRCLLFLLMFAGGCIGSTASAIKISRIIVAFKGWRNELLDMVHPRLVKKLYFNQKPINQRTLQHVLFYICAFFFFTLAGTLLLALSGLRVVDALSASLACISNVGPGLGSVGPAANYANLSAFAKYVLIFNMMIGRLEIFTVLVLFLPRAWKR